LVGPILDLIGPHVVDLADAAFVNRDAPIAYDATVIPAWSPVGIEGRRARDYYGARSKYGVAWRIFTL